MGILPILRAKDIIATLTRAGFRMIHSKGSHFRFEHFLTKRRFTISFHAARDIPRKTLRSILKQAGLTLDEFLKYLGKR